LVLMLLFWWMPISLVMLPSLRFERLTVGVGTVI
jgi:hypothetical protein